MPAKRNPNNSFTANNDEDSDAVLKELMKRSKKNEQAKSKQGHGLLFWVFSIVIVLASVFIARSPIFRLNLDKPLTANYIE
jgi:hypothetical protein